MEPPPAKTRKKRHEERHRERLSRAQAALNAPLLTQAVGPYPVQVLGDDDPSRVTVDVLYYQRKRDGSVRAWDWPRADCGGEVSRDALIDLDKPIQIEARFSAHCAWKRALVAGALQQFEKRARSKTEIDAPPCSSSRPGRRRTCTASSTATRLT